MLLGTNNMERVWDNFRSGKRVNSVTAALPKHMIYIEV